MPLRTFLALALSIGMAAAPASAAVEIEGVSFAEEHRVPGSTLRLHGVGMLRYRLLVKAYVAALYLGGGGSRESADALGDSPRRLEIEYFWPIEADDFARATLVGIERNRDPAAVAALRARIERLNGAYRDVERGDRYALTYVPGTGTELSLNGEALCVIEGSDFAAAIFDIWLGPAPLDRSLKAQLLGRS
jgi:hypothetical protein